jgi:hypothetical protein
MATTRDVRFTSLGGLIWETRARVTFLGPQRPNGVPFFRVTYTNESGERVTDVRGLSEVEARTVAEDSPEAFDLALLGALSQALTLFQDYAQGRDHGTRHPVIVATKGPRAKSWRTLETRS